MTVKSGQLYDVPSSGTNARILEQDSKTPYMWYTAIGQKRCGLTNVEYFVQNGVWRLIEEPSIAYAWYSAQAAQYSGSWAVLTVAGKVVRATAINGVNNYRWPDRVYIGDVYDGTQHDERQGSSQRSPQRSSQIQYTSAASPVPSPKIGQLVSNALGKIQASDKVVSIKPSTKPSTKPLELGETCPTCKKEWKRRELLTSSYIGCWCN